MATILLVDDDPKIRDLLRLLLANRGQVIWVVPHTGFEPVISALRGRCPRPLDECGRVAAGRGRAGV